KLEYVQGPWKNVYTKLKKGDIDLLVGIAYSEKRAKLFDFTTETLVNNWGIIYRQPDAQISSMFDLKGKRLALMKGAIHSKVLKRLLKQFNIEFILLEVDTFEDVLKAVDEGYADAGAINRLFSMLHAPNYNVVATTIVFNPVRIHYASSKSSQKSLVKVIDKHLAEQKKDSNSVYQRSVDRWLGSERREPIPLWFIWGAIIVLASMITVLVFNFLLRKEVRKRTTEFRKSERRLQAILDNSSAVIHMKDLEGNYILINRHCEMIFKTTNSEVAGKTDYDVFSKETADTFRGNDLKVLESKSSIEFEEEVYYDDNLHTYLTIKFPVNLPDGSIYGTCGISSEITERKTMEEILRKNEFNLARAQQIAHLGSWELNVVNQREVWSDETYRILGFNPNQFSPTHEQFLKSAHPDDRELIKQGLTEAIDNGKPLSMDYRIIQPDGTQRYVHLEGELLFDQDLKPSLIIGIIQDITQIKESEERLNHLAHHDPLTNLPNRLLFKDRLQQAISLGHRNKQLVALLFLDLDRFKIINDTLGHVVGDKLLQVVAKRLLKGLREVDSVARLGGDEFTVILSD
ncbi:MAG TPA: diguanylate cyclase, partial [Spirochaetes bacterium]|nr:diguanylate cyclase [Spirochaetota bacterium]